MIAAVVNLTALPKVIGMWMLHAKKDICWDLMKQLTVEEVERDTRSVSLRLHPMTRLGSVL